MINPKELRLGLYFNTPRPDQNSFRIDEIEYLTDGGAKIGQYHPEYGRSFHPLTWELKDLTPIELSEYWLERLGFVKKVDADRDDYYEYDYLQLYYWEFHNEEENGFYYRDDIRPEEIKVTSVHQLMNLYHSLSGGKEIMFNMIDKNSQSV